MCILEKFTVTQGAKIFTSICETRVLVSTLTENRHFTLSCIS